MLEPYRHRKIQNHEWGQEKTITDGPYYKLRIISAYPNNLVSPLQYHGKTHKTLHIINGFLNVQIFNCIQDALSNKESDWSKTFDYVLSEGMSVNISPLQAYKFWAIETIAQAVEASNLSDPGDVHIITEQSFAP